MNIGIVTDEISRALDEALDVAATWGLSLFELREGGKARFPGFTKEEIARVEAEIAAGATITAVSPGIFKGNVADTDRLRRELDDTLPRSLDLAQRFEAPTLILFGFECGADESTRNRVRVLRALERAAEMAEAAGINLAIENEPAFWVDRPAEAVALLRELDHPALHLNWDPANLQWGGGRIDDEAVHTLAPYLINLHVKDFSPKNPDQPWVAVGAGATPWPDILGWLGEADPAGLAHLTLETHCEPLRENAEISLERVRRMLEG
ncbi:MAG: sugar phosphate isomerase/epimerase [Rhodothermales bacterium]|nr:sugar phosphate isomerase/epimerase [Rhodothermales bacterium]